MHWVCCICFTKRKHNQDSARGGKKQGLEYQAGLRDKTSSSSLFTRVFHCSPSVCKIKNGIPAIRPSNWLMCLYSWKTHCSTQRGAITVEGLGRKMIAWVDFSSAFSSIVFKNCKVNLSSIRKSQLFAMQRRTEGPTAAVTSSKPPHFNLFLYLNSSLSTAGNFSHHTHKSKQKYRQTRTRLTHCLTNDFLLDKVGTISWCHSIQRHLHKVTPELCSRKFFNLQHEYGDSTMTLWLEEQDKNE